MRRVKLVVLAVILAAGLRPALTAEAGPAPAGPGKVILDNKTLWRVRVIRENEEIKLPSGEIGHYRLTWERRIFGKLPKGKYTLAPDQFTAKKIKAHRIPAETSPDWMKPDFDDSDWPRVIAPMMHQGRSPEWKLLLVRGRFEVENPSDLKLSLTYKGGVVVYLNGQELTRKDMLKGEKGKGPYALAEPDDKDAYICFGDKRYSRSKKDALWCVQYLFRTPKVLVEKRTRKLAGFTIPAAKLKRGVNVLAIGIHRSVAPWQYYATCDGRRMSVYRANTYAKWCRAALHEVALTGPGAVANTAAPVGKGLLVWNQNMVRKVFAGDYGDPNEKLRPVRIVGVLGGTFAGQVVAGSDRSIKGLKAVASDLSGAGSIPASAVTVRYGLPDGPRGRKAPASRIPFDSLATKPPPEVKMHPGASGAVQPLWISVKVPKDAKPGEYKGKVTVSAQGHKNVEVPVSLKVVDWTLPNYRDFTAYTDMFQSPESLAMAYDVPMWSEKHWKLIERSFELMGPLASKSVYLTCIRRTHLGNEQAMVRWKKGAGGELEPDLSIATRYLDLAVKHMGKVPSVILYAWEPTNSMGHGNTFEPGPGKIHDREILITVVGPGGKLKKEKGPKWGTPECVKFWKKLIDAVQKELKKRGIPDSMLFGLMGDHRPTKTCMADIRKAAPKLEWAIHAHHYCDKWYGTEVGLSAAVWGIKCRVADPDEGRGYGWRNKFRLLKYPRGDLNARSALANYRTMEEKWIGAMIWNAKTWPKAKGARGLGRQGADFWMVLKDKRGRSRGRLSARYPETYWGQLCINYGNPAFFGMGEDGAVPTVRSETVRENVQEIEARVFIEKALLDKAKKARLGADLAKRCRDALDERIRLCLYTMGGGYAPGDGTLWFISSGLTERMDRLFTLASEVAKKLGK